MLNGLIIIGIILWLYLLSVLNRANLIGFHFWVGSVGLFELWLLLVELISSGSYQHVLHK